MNHSQSPGCSPLRPPTTHHPPPPPPPHLSSLFVFKNIFNQELIRSVHVHKVAEGETWTEREFIFSPTSYLEISAQPLLTSRSTTDGGGGGVFEEGQMVGLWQCILAFDSDGPRSSSPVPLILSLPRNPRLRSIPTLAGDLQKVCELKHEKPNEELGNSVSEGWLKERNINFSESNGFQHDNTFNYPSDVMPQISENEQENRELTETNVPMKSKKRRAATQHVASIALKDLVKYFNLPIAEASRNLKVGLTVLKRKCREYGIPRWPHRKIKSLDTLIHSIQEEVTRQEMDQEGAGAKAAARRQRMLAHEREVLARTPFMELQGETKRFRQDVFKRRHKAKAQSKSCSKVEKPSCVDIGA